eukprot:CAMPEP_0195285266 /NCGR_PEP_ID=MMETSP0707-20130614/3163_1 /TAXON_ID=33640 /ORGANISM="Asterionellopsis glacialis, Strain CCMP134" /LENGTH=871 /DNA_ID=CAMNT_0040344739 /DNA_START=111 /DNA_END=2726 /DNA_ORIENTATION=-
MMVSAFEPTNSIDKTGSERIPKQNGIVGTSRLSPPAVSMLPYDVVSPSSASTNNYHPTKNFHQDIMEEPETEDEEVKMSCMNGVQHSDFEDDDDDDNDVLDNEGDSDDDDDDDEDSDEDENDTIERVVNFVGGQSIAGASQIQRPLPVKGQSPVQVSFAPGINIDKDETANGSSSSGEDDNSDDDTSASTSSSSSNARGCPIETSQAEVDDGSDAISTYSSESEEEEDIDDDDDDEVDDDDDDDEVEEDIVEQDDDASLSSEEEKEDAEEMPSSQKSFNEVAQEQDNGEDSVKDDSKLVKTSMIVEEDDEGGGGVKDDKDVQRKTRDKDLCVPEEEWDASETLENSSEVLNSGRRPSLSMDEIEDMLEDSSTKEEDFGEDSSDEEEPKNTRLDIKKLSEEEVVELFSDTLEFDYWSPETLKAAVDALSFVSGRASPVGLPERDDDSFWVSNMAMVVLPESKLKQYLNNNPDQRVVASRIVFDAFHTAMSAMDLTRITMDPSLSPLSEVPNEFESPRLFIGDFAAAESRLALAAHRIKRIIQISYHPLDELWKRDDITYSTHILPSLGDGGAAPVHEAILMASEEVASALNEYSDGGGAVLVTCTTGDEHACAVCALYLSRRLGISKEDAANRISELRPSCRIDPEWLHSDLSPRTEKTKRVLSCNMLSRLSRTASNPSMGFDSPKRMRRVSSGKNVADVDVADVEKPSSSNVPFLPTLDLGKAASASVEVDSTLRMRGSEEYVSSSAEEEEEDMLHSEELEEINTPPDKPSTPIPLLTPPASPVRVETDEGTATACEWPSNLAVDTAMTAVADLRPLSPNSLQKQEEEEEEQMNSRTQVNKDQFRKPEKSSLTPLIRGISIQFDGPGLDNR